MIKVKNLDKSVVVLLKKYNLLSNLVKSELIEEKISNIKINDEDQLAIKRYITQNQNLTSDDEYQEFIKQNKIDHEKLFNELSRPVKIKKYAEEKYSHQVAAKFLKRKNQLDKVVYSLIRIQSSDLIQEIYFRLKDGEEFGALAKEFSEGPEKFTRGIVGPVVLEQSTPELIKVLRSATPDQVSKPFLAGGFWLIVKLEHIIEATLDKSLEALMTQEIFESNLNEEVEEYIKIMEENQNQTQL